MIRSNDGDPGGGSPSIRTIAAIRNGLLSNSSRMIGAVGFEVRAGRVDEPVVAALIERLQGWYVELYGAPDTDPLAADDFAAPRGAFVVGEADGEPVAIGGFALRQEDGRTVARLRRVFVVPEQQRRGFAGRVLGRLEQEARSMGADTAVLSTGAPQIAAVALYRAHGYSDVPPTGHYAAWPGAVHLAKPLR